MLEQVIEITYGILPKQFEIWNKIVHKFLKDTCQCKFSNQQYVECKNNNNHLC